MINTLGRRIHKVLQETIEDICRSHNEEPDRNMMIEIADEMGKADIDLPKTVKQMGRAFQEWEKKRFPK